MHGITENSMSSTSPHHGDDDDDDDAGAGPSASRFHVLAVDDSIIDRKVIEKLFETSAYKVTTVDSGRRALEFLGLEEEDDRSSVSINDLKVNMIITDYCMPEMTGYELLKRVKESSTLKEIPVVIMSSENVPTTVSRCLAEGAEEFILKPVQISDVKRLEGHMVKVYQGTDSPFQLSGKFCLGKFN